MVAAGHKQHKRWRRMASRLLVGLLALLLLAAALGTALAWTEMGEVPRDDWLVRASLSSNYRQGRFNNLVPVRETSLADLWQMLRDYAGGGQTTPASPVPFEKRRASDYQKRPRSGVRLTWLGHSSVLLEIDGARILIDPAFSERLSPFSFVGPKRFFPSPLAIGELPPIDTVVVSHDHYDHLDRQSVIELGRRGIRFVVPLGVGSHLAYWGIDARQIVERDWWQVAEAGGSVRLVACPARHFSGRSLLGDKTLWASFAILGPKHRVFYSGDTGLSPEFSEVGQRYGPFDVALVKIGAYGRGWPDIHVDPEQALELSRMVGAKLFVPVHWGTVNLSYHGWTEPAERLIVAAEKRKVAIAIPKPGTLLEPDRPPRVERWWPDVPWEDAAGKAATSRREAP